MAVFLAEMRERSSKDGMSRDGTIKKIALSTTVAELYYVMKCFGSRQFLRGLWMDLSGEFADNHIRIDAKNLFTHLNGGK